MSNSDNFDFKSLITIKSGNIHVIEAMNTPYLDALKLQDEINQYVYHHPDEVYFLITSHEECLTMGRGLRENDIKKHDLVVDNTQRLNNSPLPLHTIKRGGGMTFHHPGQIIIYPILSVIKAKLSALELIDKLFHSVIRCVKSLYNIDLRVRHDLLGLWHEDKKICSMGIELKRFISKHGLALNVEIQDEYREKMKDLNPCGLSFDRYLSLKEISLKVNKEELINEVKKTIINDF